MNQATRLSLLVVSCLVQERLFAAEAPLGSGPIIVGSRVRIAAPAVISGRVTGSLIALDDDSMTVALDGRMPIRIPRQSVARLELSVERPRRTLKGAIIGGVLGAVFMATSADVHDGCLASDNSCFASRSQAASGGALVGAAVGALFGHGRMTDRWATVAVDRVRLSVQPPRGGGRAVKVSIGF